MPFPRYLQAVTQESSIVNVRCTYGPMFSRDCSLLNAAACALFVSLHVIVTPMRPSGSLIAYTETRTCRSYQVEHSRNCKADVHGRFRKADSLTLTHSACNVKG
jgi:hypothetical protein